MDGAKDRSGQHRAIHQKKTPLLEDERASGDTRGKTSGSFGLRTDSWRHGEETHRKKRNIMSAEIKVRVTIVFVW